MTVLIDTSVWIHVFRDRTGAAASHVLSQVADDLVTLTRFNELELLQGAANEREWATLTDYLAGQDYLEAGRDTWRDAARIYHDLRRRGRTVRSAIDCCIAQLAIEHSALLLHDDQDFDAIAEIRPLAAERLRLPPAPRSPAYSPCSTASSSRRATGRPL